MRMQRNVWKSSPPLEALLCWIAPCLHDENEKGVVAAEQPTHTRSSSQKYPQMPTSMFLMPTSMFLHVPFVGGKYCIVQSSVQLHRCHLQTNNLKRAIQVPSEEYDN
eukprot:3362265-Amphidinium_carterae.1